MAVVLFFFSDLHLAHIFGLEAWIGYSGLGVLLRFAVEEMGDRLMGRNGACLIYTNSLPDAATCMLVTTIHLQDCTGPLYLCVLSVQWIPEADFEAMELASDITPAGKVVRGLDLKYCLSAFCFSLW